MPPINPEQLLNALGPLLTNTGGIKGAQEATKIIGLMKVAKKLVNKCIYLNILRVTQSQEALEKFISLGGWDTLNMWLDTARNNDNTPLVGELLEVYLNLPVTVVLLKQNSAAKTIKQLSKADNNRIKELSGQLVERWTQTIRTQSKEEENDDKKKKKKHKDKEREKDKDKDKRDSKEKENKKEENSTESSSSSSDKSKHRDRDSSKKQSSRDKDRKDRDSKDRDRHKDRSSRHHDKSKSSSENKDPKDISSSDLKKDSSKKPLSSEQPSENSTSSLSSSSTASAAAKDSTSTMEENPRRFKTVRKVGDNFRSTGLFDDDDDDADEKEAAEEIKKKKAILEKASLPSGLKRGSMEKQEEMSDKKPRLHLTMPPINPVSLEGTGVNANNTTPPEVTHGRIKLIAPKKAPSHEIHESNVFMDALQSSTYTHGSIKRKKKMPGASPTTPPASALRPSITSSSATSPPSASSPTSTTAPTSNPTESAMSPPLLSPTSAMAQKLPSVPSFYRDTLEDLPDPEPEKEDGTSEGENEEDGPPQLDMMEVEKDEEGEKEVEQKGTGDVDMPPMSDNGSENDKIQQEDMEMEDDSGMVDDNKPNRSRKRVSWAVETRLEEVFYFEMDETERENVNRPKSFSQMRKDEMVLDRRAMDAARRVINDNMVEVLPWRHPRPIDNAIIPVVPGCNSVEKDIQMERERSVLCALFFNKVPDTPIEPEPDIPGEQADTKDIPLEEPSCTVIEHTYNLSDPSSLPYDPEYDHPVQNQGPGGPGGPQQFNNNNMNMGGGGMNGAGGGGGYMNNMNNMPPALSHLLNTLQQQARDNRDPVMANMQGMLANVVQNCNPQDSNLLMERILNVVEPFRHQIPGLSNLINSMINTGNGGGGMDNTGGFINNQGGPSRGMGGGGVPRHGILGPHPPGFSMGGNQRPPNMGGMMGANAGGGGGEGGGMDNQNYYQGGNMEGNMRMGGGVRERERDRDVRGGRGERGRGGGERGRGGGERGRGEGHWRGGKGGRGGGGRRPFGKRGRNRSQICQHFINDGCKYGDGCNFIHPTGGGYD